MKKARTKCYIYTRVSTAMQVDGYSLDAQREKLRKYADYSPRTPVRISVVIPIAIPLAVGTLRHFPADISSSSISPTFTNHAVIVL